MILPAFALMWSPPVSANPAQVAQLAHWNCLKAFTVKYDDGISSAESIGAAVAPLCYPELDVAIEARSPRSKRAKRMAQQSLRAQSVQSATLLVLENRRKR